MKKEWGRESLEYFSELNERNEIAWFRLGIMKTERSKKRSRKRKMSLM